MTGPGKPFILKSNVKGVVWPPLLAGPAASLAVLLAELERTQWLAPEELGKLQARQLPALLTHMAGQSPSFAARLKAAKLGLRDISTPETLRRLKPIGKPEIQDAGTSFFARSLPPGHEPVSQSKTSGSTGQPVVVRRTAINNLFWSAYAIREHLWNRRDITGRLSAIRSGIEAYAEGRHWGMPTNLLYVTGALQAIPIFTDIAEQAMLLAKFQPTVLKVYPSNLAGLLQLWRSGGFPLQQLKHIATMGETASDGLRADVDAVTGLGIEDQYSSQEIGAIAIQCPASGQYHIMAEALIIEILNERDEPCQEGEIGRVVATDLQNFSTPLIRYDLGDHAEMGGVCPCGRGLPTLKRILGRTRNLLRRPDGVNYWPRAVWYDFAKVAPIRQYQLVQNSLIDIEVRLVSDAELSQAQLAAMKPLILDRLGYPFNLTFVQSRERLPQTKGGKFEEFMSLIPPSA
jgi:phenylacetate-CoA ligase